MSLLTPFLERAAATPDRAAIVESSGAALSYGGLESRSARLALGFERRGIGKGDRVLVAVWPGSNLYVALAALWRLGAVAVFPEPATGLAGVRAAAAATRPKALLAGRTIRIFARFVAETTAIPLYLDPTDVAAGGRTPLVPLSADDPALISFTSGTTGPPKGMVRSHGLMLAQHSALTALLKPSAEDEVDLVAFPAFVLACIGHGATAAMPGWRVTRHDRAEPAAIIRQIVDRRVTRALLPPVIVATLASHPLPTSLHRVMTGGGPVYPDVIRRFTETSPDTRLTVVYGSTEAEPISHMAMEELDRCQWGQIAAGGGLPVGRPVPEADVRIRDDEIVVAGPHVNCGYLDPRREAETKLHEGGVVWHRTGDAGRVDGAGRLWLLGRIDGMAAGLFPFAIETMARLWPGVRAAAMVAEYGRPILFLAGEPGRRDEWRRRASSLADLRIVAMPAIPMDRRHRSKADTAALLSLLRRQSAVRRSAC